MAKSKPKKKPQGWEDSIPFVGSLRSRKTPTSATTSIKALQKGGKAGIKASTETAKFMFGDPKKGWQDIAAQSGSFLIPYGKGYKAIDKAIKGGKVIKSAKAAAKGASGASKVVKAAKAGTKAGAAKTVRGAAKGAGTLGVGAAYNKAINSTKKPKTRKGTR